MKRCYLVRHAQTSWNHENRLQGHSDLPLSPFGQHQAEALGAFFATRHLQAIFTSGLQRSRQTAEVIAAAGNGRARRPVVDHDLEEMSLGAWEGLTPEEIDARFAGAYQQWKVRPSSVAIPLGERPEAFRARVRRAAARIVAALEEGECVVVSHGGVIAAWLADLLEAEYDLLLRRLRLDNAGVTALEYGTMSPHVMWINAVAHLELPAQPPRIGRWID